ncbi:MAG: RIP metalloprotease RseP [Planctomycetota bacterium]|jgi:regulator of sigma E protease
MPILLAALGIGLLIFIHELGHFICARMAGVRVEVFSLGFGQRLFGFVYKGTDYRLSLFPLGGYVRVAGEDPVDREHALPGDLYSTSYAARAWFFSGGVLMNLLFALVTFPIVFGSGVKFLAPQVGSVAPGSPAWEAGILPGDRIESINGKETYSFENLRVEIALAGRKPIEFEIERADQQIFLEVTAEYSEEQGLYGIGITPAVEDSPLTVTSVASGSPAAQAGLREQDKIISIQGEALTGADASLALEGLSSEPGSTVTLQVEDEAGTRKIDFQPDSTRAEVATIGVLSVARKVARLRRGSEAVDKLGLRAGDSVDSIAGQGFFGNLTSVLQGLDQEGGSVDLVMQVRRQDRRLQLEANLSSTELEDLPELVAFEQDGEAVVTPVEGRPAMAAGIQAGDRITRVDGAEIRVWQDLVDAVQGQSGRELQFRVQRGDQSLDFGIRPNRQTLADLGFDTQLNRLTSIYKVDTPGAAIMAGMVCSMDLIKSLYVTLKKLFTGDVAARNLGGIVQISVVSYHYAQSGWAVFFYFLGLLSINLAFINVLPIPVLDGGHLMFLLIERIKGSPVSTRVLTYSQVLGLVFVIALMVFVTYNDILKLL